MATTPTPAATTSPTDTVIDDPAAAFIDRVAAKYAKDDARAVSAEDGVEDEDEDTDASPDDDTDEHPDADTSVDHPADTPKKGTKGATDADADSEADDAADHPEEEESTESDDDDETPTEDEEDAEPAEEDEEDDVSDDTKAALERHGATLKLDDVPKEYRPIVQDKLRHIDAAFSRAQAEATAFRRDRTQFEADKRFRDANPELVITELLDAGGEELILAVQARLDKLVDPDQAAAFRVVLKDKRREVLEAVTAETTSTERVNARVDEVEAYTRRVAAKAGIPARFAEMAVAQQLIRAQRELTNDEIDQIVRTEAKEYTKGLRASGRERSKEVVRARSASRASRTPGDRRAVVASSPRPAPGTPTRVDHNNEESRHAAMMATARRLLPGTRDK